MSGNEEIVWPEHLLDGHGLTQDDEAASQTSQGSDGIHKPSGSVQRSRQPPAHAVSLYTSDTSSARDYWDHDSRNYALYRAPAALEDDSKWEHDKFDLLKIGPPPGLGASQRHRRFGGGTSGQLQQDVGDFNTGRKSPSVIPAARFQHGQNNQQVPKLTLSEQQRLKQVNQRTDELAAIMAQIGGVPGGQQTAAKQTQGEMVVHSMRPSQPHVSSLRPSMNHMLSGAKVLNASQGPAEPQPASSQQAGPTGPKARKVLPITEPKPRKVVPIPLPKARKVLPITEARQQATARPTQNGVQSKVNRQTVGQQIFDKPRQHALAIVDPDSKAQILPTAPRVSSTSRPAASTTQTAARSNKHLVSIVDPTNKQPIQLGYHTSAAEKPVPQTADSGSKPAVKRPLQIVDPAIKAVATLPDYSQQMSSSQLSRAVSSTDVVPHSASKRPLAIVDPQDRQPIQVPVRLKDSRTSDLVSNTGAASSDTERPGKRALAIVDPQDNKPVLLPPQPVKAAVSSSPGHRKVLTIVDPQNKQRVTLPGNPDSDTAMKASSKAASEAQSLP